jgi:hypothetical protein
VTIELVVNIEVKTSILKTLPGENNFYLSFKRTDSVCLSPGDISGFVEMGALILSSP